MSEEKEFIIIPKDDSERVDKIAKIADLIINTHFENNKDKYTEAILEYFYTGSIENYFKEKK